MKGHAPRKIVSILDDVDAAAEENDEVSIGNVVEQLGDRAFGPLIALPAMAELTPLGAMPGVPTVLALIIAIFAAQVAAGRDHLWLPRLLGERSVSADRIKRARQRAQPFARKLDRWFHCRLPRFTGPVATRIAAICCLLLCLTVPPLELVPFASSLPMAAIAMFGLGMTLRDGLLMLLAYLLLGGTLVTGVYAGS